MRSPLASNEKPFDEIPFTEGHRMVSRPWFFIPIDEVIRSAIAVTKAASRL